MVFSPSAFARERGTFERLRYELFLPGGGTADVPLVVLLHGCLQNAMAIAQESAIETLARQEGFAVLYPEQSLFANGLRCWNWYDGAHQQRGFGEPAAIVRLTRAVQAAYGFSRKETYVAGFSAGGAMAHILGLGYPDVFAAVGVHSGIAFRAARNSFEALGAMRWGAIHGLPQTLSRIDHAGAPTMIIHGTNDPLIAYANATQIQWQVEATGGCAELIAVSGLGHRWSARPDANGEFWAFFRRTR